MSEYGFCAGCAAPRIRKNGYVWNAGKPDQKELSASLRCPQPSTEACKKIEWLKGTKPSELAQAPAHPSLVPASTLPTAPQAGRSGPGTAADSKDRLIAAQTAAKAACEFFHGAGAVIELGLAEDQCLAFAARLFAAIMSASSGPMSPGVPSPPQTTAARPFPAPGEALPPFPEDDPENLPF